MPIHQPQQRTDVPSDRTAVQQAEAALVEHCPRLVRLAHVVLPPALGRHRRVLTAHAVVQRALPAAGSKASSPRVPAPSRRTGPPAGAEGASADRGPSGGAYGWVRLRVLRAALAHERRPRWYVLAAGSRAVTRMEVSGAVRGAAGGQTFAVRALRDADVALTPSLREGGTLTAVH